MKVPPFPAFPAGQTEVVFVNLFGSTAFEVWDSEKATKIEESPRSKGGPPKSQLQLGQSQFFLPVFAVLGC